MGKHLENETKRIADAIVDLVQRTDGPVTFGRIERELLTRGVFTSVKDLARQIRRYIRHYNDVAKPIRWKYAHPTRRITGSTSARTGH
jgi:hypothetical protein